MSELREHCNLSDESFEARRKELRETLLPLVTGREKLEQGVALRFRDSQAMRERLDDFVAFERECCGGLEFRVLPQRNSLRLEILGIDPDSEAFGGVPESDNDEAANREREAPSSTRAGIGRALRSIGGGSALALLICCVVPLGAVALVGATVAAPLVVLDNPAVIVPAAIGMSALIWRRSARRGEEPRPLEDADARGGGCGC